MRLLGGSLAVLVVVCVVGCGGKSSYTTRRAAVNAYLASVDRAEAPLVRGTTQIDRAFARFTIATNSPAEVKQLELAQQRIATALRKVRALTPPPAAAKIHRQILQLLSGQESVASDLVLTTSYVPRLGAELQPLQQADTKLTQDLAQLNTNGKATKPLTLSAALAGFAGAFAGYESALRPIAAKLDALRPPLELRDELLVQRSAVQRSIALCSAIVAALGKKDVKTANADIHSLFVLASHTSVIGTPQAEAKALHAYDTRLAAIARLETAINVERAKLVRTVG
jgi:hypothetical protein